MHNTINLHLHSISPLRPPPPPLPQVLHCRELGMNAMVVMEQYSELELLLGAARRLGVRPSIGIRAKLTTRHNGHWGSTSGDRAKVGGCGQAGREGL